MQPHTAVPALTQDAPTRGFLLFNVLGFQAVWFAWAWGAPAEQALWPAIASVCFIAVHGWLTPKRRRDAAAVLLCVAAGVVFDTALMQADLLRFALPNPTPFDTMEPLWMMGLWACLGCTLHTGLGWLQRWRVAAYPVCAVFGWVSYEAAHRLGALTLSDDAVCVASLLVFWGVFIPWAQKLSNRLGRTRSTAHDPQVQA